VTRPREKRHASEVDPHNRRGEPVKRGKEKKEEKNRQRKGKERREKSATGRNISRRESLAVAQRLT